jgi:hypothetical protein
MQDFAAHRLKEEMVRSEACRKTSGENGDEIKAGSRMLRHDATECSNRRELGE